MSRVLGVDPDDKSNTVRSDGMQGAPPMSYEGAKRETILASGIVLSAQEKRRHRMYYRIAIQRGRDQLDRPSTWQWKSTALSSLQSLFQVLRLYGALPQEHLRVFSSPSREGLEEQLRQENSERGSSSVTAAHFLQQRMIHSSGVTSAGGARGHEGTTSTAVSTRTRLDERAIAAHAPCERS